MDLLAQAEHLATKEPRRPSQASLRRSFSGSYYALFHRLVDEATRMMISPGQRDGIRQCLSRAFFHHDMKELCTSLAGGTPHQKIAPAFQPQIVNELDYRRAPATADLKSTITALQAFYSLSRAILRATRE